jgi:hypothetical protein
MKKYGDVVVMAGFDEVQQQRQRTDNIEDEEDTTGVQEAGMESAYEDFEAEEGVQVEK